MWDQIPMLMSRTTQTLFTEDLEDPQGVLTDSRMRCRRRCRPCRRAIAPVFHPTPLCSTTDSRRYIGLGGFEYIATPELTIKSRCSTPTGRERFRTAAASATAASSRCRRRSITVSTDVDAGAEYSAGPSCCPGRLHRLVLPQRVTPRSPTTIRSV